MPIEMTLVQMIAVWALPVLLAIAVHEASHGYAARALGDRTAESLGRLSLNPLRHIDPVGTILVPLVFVVMHFPFPFGWAKPVPVNARNLGHPRRDMALVAAAGPLSNLAMALVWGLLLKLALGSGGEDLWLGLRYMAIAGIVINLVLMVLNLLPLPPLDGGRVLTGLVPEALARRLDRIEPYGLLILVVLLATGLLSQILYWPLAIAEGAVFSLLGLPPASAL